MMLELELVKRCTVSCFNISKFTFWMLVYAMIWMEDRILKLFLEFSNMKYELFVINKWVL